MHYSLGDFTLRAKPAFFFHTYIEIDFVLQFFKAVMKRDKIFNSYVSKL